jgi:hypothetical protein
MTDERDKPSGWTKHRAALTRNDSIENDKDRQRLQHHRIRDAFVDHPFLLIGPAEHFVVAFLLAIVKRVHKSHFFIPYKMEYSVTYSSVT